MKPDKLISITSFMLLLTTPVMANDTVTKLLQEYRDPATLSFSTEAGRQGNDLRRHIDDPRVKNGLQHRFRPIEPVAVILFRLFLSKNPPDLDAIPRGRSRSELP